MVVMKNAHIDNVRRKKRERFNVEVDAFPSTDDFHSHHETQETASTRQENPLEEIVSSESSTFLLSAVQRLPDHLRLVMELHMDQVSSRQIALRFNLCFGTVRTRLWRARRALTRALNEGRLEASQRRSRRGRAPVAPLASQVADQAPDRAA
jgi:RNA polymerase sigma factor (sigma-70 family)